MRETDSSNDYHPTPCQTLKATHMVVPAGPAGRGGSAISLRRDNTLTPTRQQPRSFSHALIPSITPSLPLPLPPALFHSHLAPTLSLYPSPLRSLTPSHPHSFTHSLTHSHPRSFTQSLTHSLTPSLLHLVTHSPPPSLPQSLTPSLPRSPPRSLLHSLTMPHNNCVIDSWLHRSPS